MAEPIAKQSTPPKPSEILIGAVVRHKDDPNKLTATVTQVTPFGNVAWTDIEIWGTRIHPTEDLLVVRMPKQTRVRAVA